MCCLFRLSYQCIALCRGAMHTSMRLEALKLPCSLAQMFHMHEHALSCCVALRRGSTYTSMRLEALKLLGHFIGLHEDGRQQVQAAVQGIVDSVFPTRFSEELKGAAQGKNGFTTQTWCLTNWHCGLCTSLSCPWKAIQA